MKNIITLLTVIGLFLSSSCNQKKIANNSENNAEVAEQLSQIWKEYAEAMINKDIDKMMSYHLEDFINYPAYGSTQVGLEAYKNMITGYIENSVFKDVNVEQKEVVVEGDFAFEVAIMKQKFTPEGGEPIERVLRSFSIFKKQDDGEWKLYRWIGQQ
jgi:ketosteroid isomerase-like protein